MTTTNVSAPRAAWRNIMLLIGLVLVGGAIGTLSIIAILKLFYPSIAFGEVGKVIENPAAYANGWLALMLVQGVSSSFTFLFPALIYWRIGEAYEVRPFFKRRFPSWHIIGLVVIAVVAFMPFNGWMIELNNQMKLPPVLAPIEQWMRSEEDSVAKITKFMTNFDQYWQLAMALLVIAVVPAVSEELLFRGIIQRKFFTKTQSVHVAIWVSAALFSATHQQFYGFVPRLLLGAMFGYMYMWTANLWIPIIAHFCNNAITVMMAYLGNKQIIDYQMGNTESSVPFYMVMISLVVTILILMNIKQRAKESCLVAD